MKTLQELEKQLADIQKEVEAIKQGKPEFKVGMWCKNHGDRIAIITNMDDIMSIETVLPNGDIWRSYLTSLGPATPTEIKEALEKEAVNRGLVDGAKYTVKSYKGDVFNRIVKYPLLLNSTGNGLIDVGGHYLFDATDGQWATVIKEQPLMIGGYEVKYDEQKCFEFYINDVPYSKAELGILKTIMERGQIRSLNVGCHSQHLVDIGFINKMLALK